MATMTHQSPVRAGVYSRPEDAERAVAFLRGRGVEAWVAGEIVEGSRVVRLVGSHTRG